jgi:hypothetical protein
MDEEYEYDEDTDGEDADFMRDDLSESRVGE